MDHSQVITTHAKNLLKQTGFTDSVLVQSQYDPQADNYQVLLETPEPGLLIGFHGETLSAYQLILSLHLHSELSEWLNLSVNINDYRQRRESAVFALADSTAAKVVATSQAHSLPPMPSLERRLVHMRLAEHPGVSTASEGIGRNRSVIVSPKS